MHFLRLAIPILLLSLHSCFTGIESTPRITASDVKKEHIAVTPEQEFLSDIMPVTVDQWQIGKRFYIADPKIALVLSSDVPLDTTRIVGHDLIYSGVEPLKSVMGEDMAVISFVIDGLGLLVSYRTQIPFSQFESSGQLDVPFAIDRQLVDDVKQKILGKSYFVTTPLWYTPDGANAVTGLRHVEVCIDDVQPGNAFYPIRVVFHQPGSDSRYSMFMTTGNRRTSTRNFYTLFAFENPRKKYPQITDDDWQLIIHSKVKMGMTRDECRLALGAPATIGQRPTTAGMAEIWTFANGVYLVFEDGYLTSYRS